MISELPQIADGLQKVDRAVRRTRAKHVNEANTKDLVRVFVQTYFMKWRPTAMEGLSAEQELTPLDSLMQDLLRCAQRRTLVTEYRTTLKALTRELRDLELRSLITVPADGGTEYEPQQKRILESLRQINGSAAESFEQGLLDLQAGSRRSWRGTSVEFREALREVLDQLAPDNEVKSQPGFKLEPDTKRPTMKQKAVFIQHARGARAPQVKSLSDAVDVVEELIGKFVRSVYTRSSVAVHVADSKEEARKVRDYVTLVLAELLEVGD